MYDDDYWIQNLKAIRFMEELDNDIDENAMILCEDFDIADDVCRDCWKVNGGTSSGSWMTLVSMSTWPMSSFPMDGLGRLAIGRLSGAVSALSTLLVRTSDSTQLLSV